MYCNLSISVARRRWRTSHHPTIPCSLAARYTLIDILYLTPGIKSLFHPQLEDLEHHHHLREIKSHGVRSGEQGGLYRKNCGEAVIFGNMCETMRFQTGLVFLFVQRLVKDVENLKTSYFVLVCHLDGQSFVLKRFTSIILYIHTFFSVLQM